MRLDGAIQGPGENEEAARGPPLRVLFGKVSVYQPPPEGVVEVALVNAWLPVQAATVEDP